MPEMTVAEAAERLGVTRRTLYTQIARWRLAARRSGSTWLVSEEEVERYRRVSLGRKDNHRQSFKQRFFKYVRPTGTDPFDGCWEWTGTSRDGRYGAFYVTPGRRYVPAHRVSWEMHFGPILGPIPDGMEVCHRCDNGFCVRPTHLFLGTRAQNADDMARKGRAAKGNGHGMAGKARITPDKVRDIRRRTMAGETRSALAIEYGISPSYVSRIVSGQRRGHVE